MKKTIKKTINETEISKEKFITNPLDNSVLPQNIFSKKALELYEKHADIKKFVKFVLQDELNEEDLSNIQQELRQKGVFNPLDAQSYAQLSQNKKLLEDLTEPTE